MPVNIYAPTDNDDLSADELALYHMIMEYRASFGLDPIPLSNGLTITAGRHAVDSYYNIHQVNLQLPDGANLHSWSDAPYYSDHRTAEVMWDAPTRLNTGYTGDGFEISASGYRDAAAAMNGWQGSAGHDAVMINSGIWEQLEWGAIGVGIEWHNDTRYYHVWFGVEEDSAAPQITGDAGAERFEGTDFADLIRAAGGSDTVMGGAGADTLYGGDGTDTITGGDGDDFIFGGTSAADLRDVVSAGDGHDHVNGGYGNDELGGGAGNDTIEGGFGVDTITGQDGDDVLTGSAYSDLVYGGAGADFVNGGFGSDRVNGGSGADRFFHIGVAGHGSDWVQDYSAAEGDLLQFGGTAQRSDFQINLAETAGAGDADVAEAFVIFRPTGQILWALVDGGAQDEINLLLNGTTFDLMG